MNKIAVPELTGMSVRDVYQARCRDCGGVIAMHVDAAREHERKCAERAAVLLLGVAS